MAVAFLENEIEPTNNASERALRHGTIWRKLSFGTQIQGSSRFVETLLMVIETCRQQSRNVLTLVTAAVPGPVRSIAQALTPPLSVNDASTGFDVRHFSDVEL